MKETLYYLDDHSKQDAEDNHRGNGEIKTKILLFESNISGQATNPVEPVMKEINDNTGNHYQDAGNNNPFASFMVHAVNLND